MPGGELTSQPKPIKKIAILYSHALREYFATEEHYITEAEVFGRAEVVKSYLTKMGYEAELFPGNDELSKNLQKYKPDKVVNMVDSIYGKEYLSGAIPGILETLRIPYTGTGMLGQSINANKYLTKDLLEQYGITTPKFQLIKHKTEDIDEIMDFPLFIKLNESHGSLEINHDSICHDEKNAEKQIDFLIDTYKQPLIAEEFIGGREVTVIVIEGGNTKAYAAEKIFANASSDNPFENIVTFDDNWVEEGDNKISYQKYELPERVKVQIKTAFNVLKMEDYAKFDLRVDQSGRHYLIDANSNPALGPKETGCAIGTILDMYGISFEDLLERIIKSNSNDPNQVK